MKSPEDLLVSMAPRCGEIFIANDTDTVRLVGIGADFGESFYIVEGLRGSQSQFWLASISTMDPLKDEVDAQTYAKVDAAFTLCGSTAPDRLSYVDSENPDSSPIPPLEDDEDLLDRLMELIDPARPKLAAKALSTLSAKDLPEARGYTLKQLAHILNMDGADIADITGALECLVGEGYLSKTTPLSGGEGLFFVAPNPHMAHATAA